VERRLRRCPAGPARQGALSTVHLPQTALRSFLAHDVSKIELPTILAQFLAHHRFSSPRSRSSPRQRRYRRRTRARSASRYFAEVSSPPFSLSSPHRENSQCPCSPSSAPSAATTAAPQASAQPSSLARDWTPCRRGPQRAASRCPSVQTPRALALLLRAAVPT
jgi:hypothetical protein